MTRIQLRIYIAPSGATAFMSIKRADGERYLIEAEIDTGAEVSLLPARLMDILEYRLAGKPDIVIDQAGIAGQVFKATEAYIKLRLEDLSGTQTHEFEAPVWFANTNVVLLGFADILDHAILHIDMPQHVGWIEMNA